MSPVAPLHLEGFAKGVAKPSFALAPNTIPLLGSFFLKFSDDSDGSPNNHEINTIMVQPSSIENIINIALREEGGDDEYFYNIFYHTVGTGVLDGIAEPCLAHCTRTVSPPSSNHVFVIAGFYFYYQGDEHHMDEVGILENNGEIDVYFNDKNNDDLFLYEVDYAYIPADLVADVGNNSGKGAKGATSFLISGSGRSVITGFKFNFQDDDHQLRDVGVWIRDQGAARRIELYYEDKNADDAFDWEVRWATLKD